MQRVYRRFAHWNTFQYVAQDEPGQLAMSVPGLYTLHLLNCMCLVAYGSGKYGMLHANPRNEKTLEWAKSLLTLTEASEAFIAGGLAEVQTEQRVQQIIDIFAGRDVLVTDETKSKWLPATLGKRATVRGTNQAEAFAVFVDAANGQYYLGDHQDGLEAPAAAAGSGGELFQPFSMCVPRLGRGSSDGLCILQ